MSLNFLELSPKRSFFGRRGNPALIAPLSGIRVLDMSEVRRGYEFNSLVSINNAPDHCISLLDTQTGGEVKVWLSFPEENVGGVADKIAIDKLTVWLSDIRHAAQAELESPFEWKIPDAYDMFGFSLFGESYDYSHDPVSKLACTVYRAMQKYHNKKTPPDAVTRVYETRPGRRYNITGEIGQGFSFEIIPMSNVTKDEPGVLYGKTYISDVLYRIGIKHSVLGDQLPIYYSDEVLRLIVSGHLARYSPGYQESNTYSIDFTHIG